MKKFLMYGTMLFLCMAAASCHHHDDREVILPPVVKASPNTLSGVITDMSGNPVKGASIELNDYSAVTDAKGVYTISGIAQGSYEVTASADGMLPVSATVDFTLIDRQNLLWSVALNKKMTQDLVVTNSTIEASGDVESENIPNNEEGSVNIKVEVPANTVPDNTTISITPIYSEASAAISRAAESTLLIGATLSCSNENLVLTSPVELTFALDASVVTAVTVKEYDAETDSWKNIDAEIDATGNVLIKATKFTSYGIFLPVSVASTSSNEAIVFATSVFDNRDGNGSMRVESASYTYKSGTQINTTANNKLEGLLIEYLARRFGAKVTEIQGEYPLNVTLAVGQGVRLNGSQASNAIVVSSGNTAVRGTGYGNVNIVVTPFSVDHNGGDGGNI